MTDFRDQHVQKALDEAIPPWRPERDARSRRRRIAIFAALAAVAVVAFWTILYFSSPRHAAPARKAMPIELLPPPGKR